MLDQVVHWLA